MKFTYLPYYILYYLMISTLKSNFYRKEGTVGDKVRSSLPERLDVPLEDAKKMTNFKP